MDPWAEHWRQQREAKAAAKATWWARPAPVRERFDYTSAAIGLFGFLALAELFYASFYG